MFTAPPWGIEEAEVEMGATIYRRIRAECRHDRHERPPRAVHVQGAAERAVLEVHARVRQRRIG